MGRYLLGWDSPSSEEEVGGELGMLRRDREREVCAPGEGSGETRPGEKCLRGSNFWSRKELRGSEISEGPAETGVRRPLEEGTA